MAPAQDIHIDVGPDRVTAVGSVTVESGGLLTARAEILQACTPDGSWGAVINGGGGSYAVTSGDYFKREMHNTNSGTVAYSANADTCYLHDGIDHMKPIGGIVSTFRTIYCRKHRTDLAPGGTPHYDGIQHRHTEGKFIAEDIVFESFRYNGSTLVLSNGYPQGSSQSIIYQSAEGPTATSARDSEVRRCWFEGGTHAFYQVRKEGQGYNTAPLDTHFTGNRFYFDMYSTFVVFETGTPEQAFADWSDNALVDPLTDEVVMWMDEPVMPNGNQWNQGNIRSYLGLPSVSTQPARLRADGSVLNASQLIAKVGPGFVQ